MLVVSFLLGAEAEAADLKHEAAGTARTTPATARPSTQHPRQIIADSYFPLLDSPPSGSLRQ